VNQEKLNYIAENPSAINAEDARELEELTKTFPYFSLPFALLTRYYSKQNDYRFEDLLHKTALRVHNREWLYQLLHQNDAELKSEMGQIPEVTTEAPGISVVLETEVSNTEIHEKSEGEALLEDVVEILEEQHLNSSTIEETEEVLPEIAEFQPEVSITLEIPETKTTDPIGELPEAEKTELYIDLETEKPGIPELEMVKLEPAEEHQTLVEPAQDKDVVEEDAVFEEIMPFEHENPMPLLMQDDNEALELLAEFELTPSMVEPDFEEESDVTVQEQEERKMPQVSAVYNIEDYFTADEDQTGPPSDFFSWLKNPEYSGTMPPPPIVEEKGKNDLIEKFIRNPVGISRPKSDFFNPADVARKSEQFPDDIATETLAGVYLKQENYSGAIRIYEKLILKIPSKKAYFAALIDKIKKEHHL